MPPGWTPRAVVLVLALTLPACYRNAVVVPGSDAVTEWRGKTVHSYLWGLLKSQNAKAHDCERSKGLATVRSDTNLGYALLTVVTLGIWSPTRLEWRCARLVGITGDMEP